MEIKDYPNKHWFKRYIHYNPYTGQFTRIQKTSNGKPLGVMSTEKRSFKLQQEWYMFNAVAWIYMTGERPKNRIRFKDGNPQNLKFDNLTLESTACYARKKGSKWYSYFYLPYEHIQYHVGVYDNEEQAREAAHAARNLKLEKSADESHLRMNNGN